MTRPDDETPDFAPTTRRDDRPPEEGTYFAPPPGFDPSQDQMWWVQNGTDDMIRIFYTKHARGGLLVVPGGNAFFTGLGKMFGIYVFWDGAKPQPERIYHRIVTEKEAQEISKPGN